MGNATASVRFNRKDRRELMRFADCVLYIKPYIYPQKITVDVGCSIRLLHAWVNIEIVMNKPWRVGHCVDTKLEVKGM